MPRYPEAYYNLGRSLEANRQYDEAAKQLNYYLELNPSPDDTRSAKDLTYKLSAEGEAAVRKQQERERELPLRYVSGGAERRTRLRIRPRTGTLANSVESSSFMLIRFQKKPLLRQHLPNAQWALYRGDVGGEGRAVQRYRL